MAVCLAVLAPALALGACDNGGVRITTTRSDTDAKGVLKVVDALQCPDSLGSLTRKGSARADGAVCTYTGPRGAEVELHLVTLGDDGADPILKRFEAGLLAVMPQTAADISRSAADSARADAEAARADAESARAEADAARAEAAAEAGAYAGAGAGANAGGDSAHVSAPGMRVDAEGDRASVHMPGIHVEADGDKADVRIGGITIHANDGEGTVNGQLTTGDNEKAVSFKARDDAAEIRTRSPGEAVRQTYLLTDNRPSPNGWRTVGYEARGPRTGPIVVATVRSRERNADGVFDDAKELVTLNVGE
ncbi:methyltransferase type 11 [Brevundimonas goettingensis]|uniref:Methyltransferase type 11 n=1 Tax=Brevundimonas goettingensis TaxID=2774190 RepID=A0A975GXV4_9CAUL|nr:methyltransferase type 11 [Brevundimonas goettingensis]